MGDSFRLRIVGQWKGYLCLNFLEKEGAFWLLLTVDEVARVNDNAKVQRLSKNLHGPTL
jgi:hypothetical protein